MLILLIVLLDYFFFSFENMEKFEVMVAEELEVGLVLKVELVVEEAEERGRMKSPRNQLGASLPTLKRFRAFIKHCFFLKILSFF